MGCEANDNMHLVLEAALSKVFSLRRGSAIQVSSQGLHGADTLTVLGPHRQGHIHDAAGALVQLGRP